jgi:hypothetical protein
MISPEEAKSAVRVLTNRGLLGLSIQQRFADSVAWARSNGYITERKPEPTVVVAKAKNLSIDNGASKAQCPTCDRFIIIFQNGGKWFFNMHRCRVDGRGREYGQVCAMAEKEVLL